MLKFLTPTLRKSLKLAVDLLMALALLSLMGYHLWGDVAHEWLGAGMFLLFLLHHLLNARWYGSLRAGKWPPVRTAIAIVNTFLFLDMLCLMASGFILSRHVFAAFNGSIGLTLGRRLHILGSYWGFVLMSVHMGLHGGRMAGAAKKYSKAVTILLRLGIALAAGYGLFAFLRRGFPTYMLLQSEFVFLDYGEPRFLFYLDHLAIMVFLGAAGYYLLRLLSAAQRLKQKGDQG